MVAIIRDSGSNMVKACKLWHVKHFACIAHNLHLIVGPLVTPTKAELLKISANCTNAIPLINDEQPSTNLFEIDDDDVDYDENDIEDDATPCEIEIHEVVSRFRRIASYFKNSCKARSWINECRTQVGKTPYAINLDCRTRWNSCHDMLTKLITMRDTISMFFAFIRTVDGKAQFSDVKIRMPSNYDWDLIQCLQRTLQPIYDLTRAISGEKYSTFAIALPYLRMCRDELAKDLNTKEYMDASHYSKLDRSIKNIRSILYHRYRERFSCMDINIMWITMLDPRIRNNLEHLTSEEAAFSKKKLIAECEKIQVRDLMLKSDRRVSSESESDNEELSIILKYRKIRKQKRHATLSSSTSEAVKSTCELEVNHYIREMECDWDEDPLQWWKANALKFPRLASLARKWLCVVATSTPSERVFSGCGLSLTPKRSRLKSDMLRRQIIVHDNLKNVQIDMEQYFRHLKKSSSRLNECPN